MSVIARVYIVRHGETDWNRRRIIQGHIDTELNASGLAQAALAAEALKDVPFVQAFTSDLQRASKTAEIILERQRHPGAVLVKDQALRERFMGERQGEVGPSNKPAPSLETGESIVKRSIGWWNQTIVKYVSSLTTGDEPCQNVLVASHGGLISTLIRTLILSKVLFAPDMKVGSCFNASITLVEYRMTGVGRNRAVDGWVLKYADVSHLIKRLPLVQENVDVENTQS
ncbi:phosphoglycerate mutase-like protein [Leucogyrophana mollusca]|uniref:Phosphoglycerate mutase-like protein n=1 Tax=Leucogyrophana mollusca TaxID=85980 RepID=A0ACB8B673_9AGAM|nr:phosphoglycerate mutase-like protein [Leucogyrophana mollusca]